MNNTSEGKSPRDYLIANSFLLSFAVIAGVNWVSEKRIAGHDSVRYLIGFLACAAIFLGVHLLLTGKFAASVDRYYARPKDRKNIKASAYVCMFAYALLMCVQANPEMKEMLYWIVIGAIVFGPWFVALAFAPFEDKGSGGRSG